MDDHQSANARRLEAVGGALIAPEAELDAPGLAARLTALMDDPKKLAVRGRAAREIAMRDAASNIASHALGMAGAMRAHNGTWEVAR